MNTTECWRDRIAAVRVAEALYAFGQQQDRIVGPGPGMTVSARDRAQVEYNARKARQAEQRAQCQGCKAAKTRLANGNAKSAWTRKGECKNHYYSRIVAYNTSPISETYWAS